VKDWIQEGSGAREARRVLKNILAKSTGISPYHRERSKVASEICKVLRFYEFYNEIEEL